MGVNMNTEPVWNAMNEDRRRLVPVRDAANDALADVVLAQVAYLVRGTVRDAEALVVDGPWHDIDGAHIHVKQVLGKDDKVLAEQLADDPRLAELFEELPEDVDHELDYLAQLGVEPVEGQLSLPHGPMPPEQGYTVIGTRDGSGALTVAGVASGRHTLAEVNTGSDDAWRYAQFYAAESPDEAERMAYVECGGVRETEGFDLIGWEYVGGVEVDVTGGPTPMAFVEEYLGNGLYRLETHVQDDDSGELRERRPEKFEAVYSGVANPDELPVITGRNGNSQ